MNVKYPKSLDLRSPEKRLIDTLVVRKEIDMIVHTFHVNPTDVTLTAKDADGDNVYNVKIDGKNLRVFMKER